MMKRIITLCTIIISASISANAQTVLLSPTGDGGFENATTTFAGNGWTSVLPGATRQWQVGTAATSVAPGTKSAYVGAAANYNGANGAQVGHFYRDLTIPAGATAVTLSFYHRLPNPDPTYDFLRVFTTTTANTPISGTSPGAGYTLRFENTNNTYSAFTAMAPIDLTALAGTTVRLVFTNVSDGVAPPSAIAIDNISITYIPGSACTGTPTAGTAGAAPSSLSCSGTTSLSLTGSTSATGITYQWQSSPDNVTFTNIASATTMPYTTGTISASTYFRCRVTCTPSGLSANSTSVLVTVNPVAGGTTASTANPVCSGTSFTLSLTGATTTGVTYQWQSSPDNVTYTNIAGATSATRAQTQTASTYYRCAVTCTASATSANSAPLLVNVAGCVNITNGSSTTCSSNFYDSGGPSAAYANNESFVYTFYPNPGNSVRMTWSSFASESGYDFITIYNGPSISSPVLYGPLSGTLSIPTFTSTDGSGALTFRFTSDAIITAAGWAATASCIANPPCSGTPSASTTVAASNPACYNTAFNVSLSSSYILSGITFQWQSAPDVSGSPGTFANVPSGGNTSVYSATQTATTWYHCIVTCTNGGASITSSDLQVTTQLCYCTPVYATGCANDKITNLVLNTLSNNTGAACSTSPPGYSVYGTSPASQTTSLIKGNTYTATITVATGNANGTGATIWIDYNDNGVFETSERSDNGATKFVSNTTGTISVTVPGSAPAGVHRMRVRSMRNTLSDAIDPCLAGNQFGETEDYSVTILPCGATAGATSPICQYLNQNLTSTYFGNGTPLSYSWSGPNGFTSSLQNPTITNIQPADAGTYTVTITDDAACVSEANVTIAVTDGPDPVASSNSPVCEGGTISFSADNIAPGQSTGNLFQWTGPSFSSSQQSPSIGSATSANDGSYTVVITNQFLCTATSAPVLVTVTTGPVPVIASQTNASCNGLQDGAVDVDAPTGTLYTDGSNFNTDGVFTGLPAGIHTITAYDGYGCTGDIQVTITEPAVLNISAASNGPLCDGSTLNLSSSATGGTTTYGWSWSGPSYTSSDEDPIITGATAAATGTYTVTVTDANGCTDDATTNVIVHASIPAAPGAVSGPSSVCAPANNVLLSVTPVADADYYSWVLSPGTNAVTFTGTTDQSSILANFGTTANSTYAIRVYAVNACGTSTGYGPFFTRRAVSTPLNPTGDNLACANDVKPYTIPTVTGAETYTWSGPAGSLIDGNPTPYTANVTSVNVTFPSGFSSGTVCVAANVGCFTTVNKCISVNSAAVSLGVITGATYTVCPGNIYTYSVPPAAGAASYTWTLPANITGSSSTNSINVTVNAGFTSGDIKVFATSICGSNSAQKSRSLVAGIPSVPASISGPTNGLCGQTAVYTCPAQTGVTYNWNIPPGATINNGSGTNSISVTFGTFTTSTVCVTATNTCGTSASRCVTVRGAPNTPASIIAAPGSWCANEQDILFTANVANVTGAYTLSWTYPSASIATYSSGGGNSTSLTLDWIAGTGNVIVTAANACGSGSQKYVASNSCREEGFTLDENFINVSPNPAHDFIDVSFTMQSKDVANLTVTDLSARTLLSNSFNTEIGLNKTQLDVRNIAKGLYIVSLRTNGETVQKRIVIE